MRDLALIGFLAVRLIDRNGTGPAPKQQPSDEQQAEWQAFGM